MLELWNIPIEIYWRALDLYGENRASSINECEALLRSAQSRKSIVPEFNGFDPFSQAIAEYLSCSGAFSEEGEFSCSGYTCS